MNTRNRLVNFRVTDEEFRRLKNASTLKKARCLSDFARSAVLETARAYDPVPDPEESVASQLQAFDHRLARLESHISRLIGPITEDKQAENMKSEG